MTKTTTRILACFGMFLMVFLLAADVTARGRGPTLRHAVAAGAGAEADVAEAE